MKKFILLVFSIFLLVAFHADAQISGTSAFLKGRWLEAGVNSLGALGATAPPVALGYHPYPPTADGLASVYDYGHDGWTAGMPAFYGDYTWNPTPTEGWELQVNDLRNQAFTYSTPLSITGPGTLSGAITGYSNTGGVAACTWAGTAASGALDISMVTQIDTNASWILVTVSFYNSGTTTLPNIYYLRSAYAQNDEAHGGGSFTNNTIIHQNEDSTHKVQVDAKGAMYNDHWSLCTKDSRAVAFICQPWPLSLSTDIASVWNQSYVGTGSQYALGGTLDGDYCIGIIYNIGDLAPGGTTTISYAYVYDSVGGIDSALPAACTGTPVAGTITSNTSLACATTSISLSDTGSTLAAVYQWQSSPDSLTWTNIPGVVTAMYNFTGLSANTYYRCLVGCTLDSTVYVATPGILENYTTTCPCLLFNSGIVSANLPYACAADTVLLSDNYYNAPLALLQWQSSTDSVIWSNIPGATSSAYSFTGCSATAWYRLAFMCIADTMVSTAKKIPYSPLCICTDTPDAGGATASVTTCSACSLTLNLAGSSAAGSLTYQWQYSSDSLSWSNLSGATTIPYSFSPHQGDYYRCVVTCSFSASSAYSEGVFVAYHYRIIADSTVNTPDTSCTATDFYVRVNGTSPLLTAKTYFGDGSFATSSLISSGSTASANISHTYVCPGIYTIKQMIYNNSVLQDSVTYPYDYRHCKTLPLKFYMDENGDCVKNNTELFNGSPLLVVIDSNGITIDTASATSGLYYKAFGPPGTIYSFSILSSAVSASCPADLWVSDTISAIVNEYPIKYYGLTCTSSGSGFDLSVADVISVTGQFDQCGNIFIANSYCVNTDVAVTLNRSQLYNSSGPTSCNPIPSSYTDSTATWSLAGISSTTGISHIYYSLWASPLIPAGKIANTYVAITPTTGDLDTANNHCTIVDTVKAGCDPNEMSVSPATCIQPDSVTKLQYTISFVNTGNDTAHNIYVMDTLPNNVDANSLRVLMASATMNIEVFNDGVHNIAKFDFPQINLLDSAFNSAACSGAVIYTINTLPGLTAGATVQNHAGIFFDINPVVMTNTVANKVGCTDLGVAAIHNSNTSIYPNPTHESLTIISSGNISNIIITNILGQNVFSSDYSASQVQVNVAALPAGVYFVKINGNEVRKFVKE